jgi:hypothetical protein
MQPENAMTLERPTVPTVRIIARDEETGRSKCMTVYMATPEQIIERITPVFDQSERQKPGDEKQPAAA